MSVVALQFLEGQCTGLDTDDNGALRTQLESRELLIMYCFCSLELRLVDKG